MGGITKGELFTLLRKCPDNAKIEVQIYQEDMENNKFICLGESRKTPNVFTRILFFDVTKAAEFDPEAGVISLLTVAKE